MSGCTNGDEGKPARERIVTEREMDGGGLRLSSVKRKSVEAQRELSENRIFETSET